jgi:hypothetical protein
MQPITFSYRIGDQELERVEEIKDLGVFLETRMTFLNHIETIIAIPHYRIIGKDVRFQRV